MKLAENKLDVLSWPRNSLARRWDGRAEWRGAEGRREDRTVWAGCPSKGTNGSGRCRLSSKTKWSSHGHVRQSKDLSRKGTKETKEKGRKGDKLGQRQQLEHSTPPPKPKWTKGEGVLEALGEAVVLELSAGRWGEHVLERGDEEKPGRVKACRCASWVGVMHARVRVLLWRTRWRRAASCIRAESLQLTHQQPRPGVFQPCHVW